MPEEPAKAKIVDVGGRPKETPSVLAKRELKESLKQQAEVRELFREQLAKLREALKDKELTLKDRIDAMAALAAMNEAISKGTMGLMKWVLPKDEEQATPVVELEKILGELLEGKRT